MHPFKSIFADSVLGCITTSTESQHVLHVPVEKHANLYAHSTGFDCGLKKERTRKKMQPSTRGNARDCVYCLQICRHQGHHFDGETTTRSSRNDGDNANSPLAHMPIRLPQLLSIVVAANPSPSHSSSPAHMQKRIRSYPHIHIHTQKHRHIICFRPCSARSRPCARAPHRLPNRSVGLTTLAYAHQHCY